MMTMDMIESVLTDEWETARVLLDRLSYDGTSDHVFNRFAGLVAKRRALRRPSPWGSLPRWEYRRA